MPTRDPTSRSHTFWYLSASASTQKSGAWQPTPADQDWWFGFERRRKLQRPLRPREWPSPPFLFTSDRTTRLPDAAWEPGAPPIIVSSKFRAFIQSESPKLATFLPVRLRGPKSKPIKAQYWCAVWKRRWRCQPDAHVSDIDAARIPVNERIGIVAGRGWWSGGQLLVRNDLRLELKKAGFIGFTFQPVRLRLPPTALVRGLNPRTGKRELIERRLLPHEPQFDVNAFFRAGGKANGPGMVPNSTPFLDYVASHSGMGTLKPAVVNRFLKDGGNPNVGIAPNVSALLVVLNPKTPALIRALAKHGADFNVQNSLNGYSPLMSAVRGASIETIQEMLRAGADPGLRDRAGMTALDHAREDVASGDLRPEFATKLTAILSRPKSTSHQKRKVRNLHTAA